MVELMRNAECGVRNYVNLHFCAICIARLTLYRCIYKASNNNQNA